MGLSVWAGYRIHSVVKIMDLFGFILVASSIAEFSISAYLIVIDKAYGFPISGLFFLFLGMVSFASGYFMFVFTSIHKIKKLSNEHFKLSKKMSLVWGGKNNTITFVKKGKDWYCEGFGDPVKFNLRWFFFKKSFLFSFATRAMRYPLISKQRPTYYIGKYRLKGLNKKKIIKVEYKYNNRVKTRILVKNGVSKYGFIPWAIAHSNTRPPIEFGIMSGRYGETIGSMIFELDEEFFCDFYKYSFKEKKEEKR